MKKYTFISEYRGGTYISQYLVDNLDLALYMWAKSLDLEFYKKEDKKSC